MRLLADENIHGAIVEWLRAQSHDVLYAAESLSARVDPDVLEIARSERRVLLTSDRDFAELVFLNSKPAAGIILLRLGRCGLARRLELLNRHWAFIEARANTHFVVVGVGKVRARPLPKRGSN